MIETKRLLIKPLTCTQLVKYIRCDNSLEEELQLNRYERSISQELKEALEQTIMPGAAVASKNYLYSTLWTLIVKEAGKMAGDICITEVSKSPGVIEIGYGMYKEFQGKGIMKEAVGGFINWVTSQPEIFSIIASTDKENIASSTILMRNNFEMTRETESSYNWELKLKFIL